MKIERSLKRNTHLHSREHVLADDLSQMLLEPKRFGAYLGIAKMYEEFDLRSLAKFVAAKPDLDPKARGRYFFGALRSLPRRASWLSMMRRKKGRLGRTRTKRRQKAMTKKTNNSKAV